jgi:hypothetical protein
VASRRGVASRGVASRGVASRGVASRGVASKEDGRRIRANSPAVSEVIRGRLGRVCGLSCFSFASATNLGCILFGS